MCKSCVTWEEVTLSWRKSRLLDDPPTKGWARRSFAGGGTEQLCSDINKDSCWSTHSVLLMMMPSTRDANYSQFLDVTICYHVMIVELRSKLSVKLIFFRPPNTLKMEIFESQMSCERWLAQAIIQKHSNLCVYKAAKLLSDSNFGNKPICTHKRSYFPSKILEGYVSQKHHLQSSIHGDNEL